MRIALIGLMVTSLAAPAHAEMFGKQQKSQPTQQESAEQKKRAKEAEEAYKAALRKIPDKKPDADPWKNVR